MATQPALHEVKYTESACPKCDAEATIKLKKIGHRFRGVGISKDCSCDLSTKEYIRLFKSAEPCND